MKFQKTILAALLMGVCLTVSHEDVQAAGNTITSVLPQAGVAGVLEKEVTEEEYKQAAADMKAQRKAIYGYENLGVANVNDYLNVRKEPGEDKELAGKMPKNAGCEILGTEGEWTKIKSGKVQGYVKSEYLLSGSQAREKADEVATNMAVCNSGGLYVREEPNTECSILTQIAEGEELEVVEVLDEWVKIMLDDEEAYVFGEYVDVAKKLEKAVTITEVKHGEGVSDVRVDLVNYAKQFLGNPYVWGGVSLTKGADCSGFVLSVFKKYGYSLPHYSVSQSNMGKKISLADAKPGDLVFYAKNGTVNHVAIYIGGGQVIHASNPRTGIKISNATYRTPHSVRRILP